MLLLLSLFAIYPCLGLLINNGDFSFPALKDDQMKLQYTPQANQAWQELNGNLVQVGLASCYNQNLVPFKKVIHLDTNKNLIVKQDVNLQQGTYQLCFTWSSFENYFLTSQGEVTFGITLPLTPSDDYPHRTCFERTFSAKISTTVTFAAKGTADGHGIIISDVSLLPVSEVKNSGFEYPALPNQKYMDYVNGIPGWRGSLVRLENGRRHNSNWNLGQVLWLVGKSVATQTGIIPLGRYRFQIEWAPYEKTQLFGQQFSIVWNGISLQTFNASDYSRTYNAFQVDVTNKNNNLTFVGSTTLPQSGIAIDNVLFTRIV